MILDISILNAIMHLHYNASKVNKVIKCWVLRTDVLITNRWTKGQTEETVEIGIYLDIF